jgi:hypothetical protein
LALPDVAAWWFGIMTDVINTVGDLYRETPNIRSTPHGPQNVHPTWLSCRDGTMYNLFPGAPHSIVGYNLGHFHKDTGFFRPSQFKNFDPVSMWLSLGDVADRVGYIPTLSQDGWVYYILALIDNVYSVNGYRHLDNAVWIPWLSEEMGVITITLTST